MSFRLRRYLLYLLLTKALIIQVKSGTLKDRTTSYLQGQLKEHNTKEMYEGFVTLYIQRKTPHITSLMHYTAK